MLVSFIFWDGGMGMLFVFWVNFGEVWFWGLVNWLYIFCCLLFGIVLYRYCCRNVSCGNWKERLFKLIFYLKIGLIMFIFVMFLERGKIVYKIENFSICLMLLFFI